MSEAKHYLVKLLLQDELTGMYASRRLRPGMELELQLERDPANFSISAFFEGRYLGRIDPILPEFIAWFQDFEDNRCSVASLPITYREHMLRVVLVRIEKGQRAHGETVPMQPPPPKRKPEPEPEALPAPLPPLSPIHDLPAPVPMFEPFPPERRGWRPTGFLGAYVMAVLAAGAGAAYIVMPEIDPGPCGRLRKAMPEITSCQVQGADELWINTTGTDAGALCGGNAGAMLPAGTLLRVRLDGPSSPRFVVCRSQSAISNQ